MLKKVLVGGCLVLMIGAMVAGVIVLFGRSESAYACGGSGGQERVTAAGRGPGGGGSRGAGGREDGCDEECDTPGNSLPQGSPGGGQRRGGENQGGSAPQDGSGERSPGGGNGGGQGRGQGSGAVPEAQGAEWQTIEGLVLETTELVIETAEGQTVQVGLGPSHYREAQGFVLNVGNKVQVSGYWEDGEFKAAQVENLDTGDSIILRDASGRPMWAGQGRGRGQGI